MSVRLTHWTRGRLLITCTAFVCFAAIVTLSVRLAEIGGSGGLSKDGGRVVSDDGNISVAFAPHEIDEGTTIRINPRVIPPAVPAAPSLLRPVTHRSQSKPVEVWRGQVSSQCDIRRSRKGLTRPGWSCSSTRGLGGAFSVRLLISRREQ